MLAESVILRLEVQEMRHAVLHHLQLHHKDVEARVVEAVNEALSDDALFKDLTQHVRRVTQDILKDAITRTLQYELPSDERFKSLVQNIVTDAMK